MDTAGQLNNNNNGKSNMLGLGDLAKLCCAGRVHMASCLCVVPPVLGFQTRFPSLPPLESSPCLISRFILSLGKEEKEQICAFLSRLEATVQLSIIQNCFSFFERVHCV